MVSVAEKGEEVDFPGNALASRQDFITFSEKSMMGIDKSPCVPAFTLFSQNTTSFKKEWR